MRRRLQWQRGQRGHTRSACAWRATPPCAEQARAQTHAGGGNARLDGVDKVDLQAQRLHREDGALVAHVPVDLRAAGQHSLADRTHPSARASASASCAPRRPAAPPHTAPAAARHTNWRASRLGRQRAARRRAHGVGHTVCDWIESTRGTGATFRIRGGAIVRFPSRRRPPSTLPRNRGRPSPRSRPRSRPAIFSFFLGTNSAEHGEASRQRTRTGSDICAHGRRARRMHTRATLAGISAPCGRFFLRQRGARR